MWSKVFLITLVLGQQVSAEPLKLDADLGGVKSDSTAYILKKMNEPQAAKEAFELKCLEHENNDLYIGLEQRVRIHAPLSRVEAVLNDIDQYKDLFPGYKDVHVVSKEENRWLTFWEQRVPLFFVPNVKYEMIYVVDHSHAGRVLYRYQLQKEDTLKASDGLISLTKVDAHQTDFVEYDFFDAHWGAAKILGKSKIWNDAVSGIYQSDLAIQLKAENEDWTSKQAREEAENKLQKNLVESCLQKKEKI